MGGKIKLAVIISSNDAETCWNAIRYANFAIGQNDEVKVFFMGKGEGKFYVYIIECANGTYYAGSTNNIEKRLELHNKGYGARFLRGKRPVKMVYSKECGDKL